MPTLDWLHREAAFQTAARVPTRVLRPHAAGHVFGDPAHAGNLLIHGDNLEALKALLPFYRGRVKCIFIDPPYNTQSAFEHYDDNLEHSQWLSMMLPRLQLLRELLSEDGSIWVTIDDNEGHYLKVLMDEVFGRRNFVANVVWQKSYTSNQTAKHLSDTHDHVLVYARNEPLLQVGKLQRTEEQIASFKNPDGDPRGPWKAENLSAGKFYSAGQFPIVGPTNETFLPPPNRYWRCNEAQYTAWLADGRITFGQKGTGRPMLKKYLAEMTQGLTANTWWDHAAFGSNKEASIGLKEVLAGTPDIFQTPKPEKLLQRVLELATNPGDLVLDSFLGSGTTAAVAHKMGRRWIGIEMGEHAVTHCLPRLQKVVDGEQGGISEAVAWQGGGGFQLLQLGAPLFDEQGDIHPEVRFADLAAFIWMRETGTALPLDAAPSATRLPRLGVHEGTAYYLLFNGILGDRRPAGGNVLTTAVLQALHELCGHDGPKVVYGEACRLGDARLAAEGISFKQLPHAVPR
ncbi:MAG TPA: site-specific DNA-methyltransferase [Hydrogenophaga sp.]|uniref:site-specific DNA-methyltransferase n=1 Tax=Hydrogenophaga sp. TaxID=1904254 RepID=UPI002C00623F|nr:site-specific DNA-methyltransferase [Hydrogenophaga sp.]HMN93248.1 site-specific DNA-methyltransferase [Hydrogenophaga sp.]HMP11720.1 site-specific DNA-methyltransferase [Hydrogenophaga sp.]